MNKPSRHPCIVNISSISKTQVSVMFADGRTVIVPYPEPRYRRVGDDQSEVILQTGPTVAYCSDEKPDDVWLLDKREGKPLLSMTNEKLILRLHEAEKIISKIARGLGEYNHHLIICNYQHKDCEWCNCGVADARMYAKKYNDVEQSK